MTRLRDDADRQGGTGQTILSLLRAALGHLITPVLAGIILTLLAPLGTHSLDIGYRALFWIGLCLAGGYGAMAVRWGLTRYAPNLLGWRRIVLQSFGATAAVAPFVIASVGLSGLSAIVLTLFYIWIIAIVITSFGEMAAARTAPIENADIPIRPALMERLPMKLRDATLYAAQSEDHYVRVYTSAGDHLVLMRLGDIADLARPLNGLRPHRSWWVAEVGVEQVRRQSGKMVIVLKDGTDVPVSRSGAKRVKDAGWLG